MSQERNAGRIAVIVRATPAQVLIEVRNTGPAPRDPSTRDRVGAGTASRSGQGGEGFGLHSVRERLKGHFGERAAFELTRDGAANMTVARITMPHTKVVA